MEKDQEKGLDNLFKQGLQDNPVNQHYYREDDWDALEQMLNKGKKRRIVFWLPVLSGVAAVLLLIFGLWWYKTPVEVVKPKPDQPVVKLNTHAPITEIAKTPPATISSGSKIEKSNSALNATPVANVLPVKPNGKLQTIVTKQIAFVKPTVQKVIKENTGATNDANTNASKTTVDKNALTNSNTKATIVGNDKIIDNSNINKTTVDNSTAAIVANTKITTLSNDKIIAAVRDAGNNTIIDTPAKVIAKADNKPVKKASLSPLFKPTFAVSVMASTELNAVESFGQNKVGSNFSLLFSATLIPKFTITTGASYATKPYRTDFEDYYTTYKFASNPTSIQADCRVLDIPLNIDYQVYNKHRNKFSVGTGISSYIMLHESYNYIYNDPSASPATFQVKNPNKYLFSIINLQATYQRQINSKIGLSLQPYYKLPLADIGSSRVKLQTVGIAVGVNMNFGSLGKR